MNVDKIIKSELFKEWMGKNITFEPVNEWYSCGNLNQRCAIVFETLRIGAECSYFPHNFLKDPIHWQYVTEEVNITPSDDFKSFFKMEQDPYASENHYPRWTDLEAAVFYWITKNRPAVAASLLTE